MSSILSRVSAVVEQLSGKELSVGDHDRVTQHLEMSQMIQFTEELEDEFKVKLDSDDIIEASTVMDVAKVVTETMGRLTAH